MCEMPAVGVFNVAYGHQSPQISFLGFAKSFHELDKGYFRAKTELARTPKYGKGLLVELMAGVEDVEVVSPSANLVVLNWLWRYQTQLRQRIFDHNIWSMTYIVVVVPVVNRETACQCPTSPRTLRLYQQDGSCDLVMLS